MGKDADKDAPKEAVIILENGRCAWGKCIFCSLSKKLHVFSKSEEELKREFLRKIKSIGRNIKQVKIFNSGTFIDDRQIPRDVRKFIFNELRERGISEVVIEVWPPFVNEVKMKELKEDAQGLIVHLAMGLESADDDVLRNIRKGFDISTFVRAVETAKRYGFKVRIYVMVNLPGVKDAKKDFENTINFALRYADSIAVMNTFAYSGYAELFDMWLKGEWRPLPPDEFRRIVHPYKHHSKIEIYERDYITYPRFPEEYKKRAEKSLRGATFENLTHPYYRVWQEYLAYFYEKPKVKKYALFLHCSFKKPYSSSPTHRKIISYLQRSKYYPYIHQLIISNPGVIPREFENCYPFNAYDWPEYEETAEIKKAYIEVNSKRIEEYLKHHRYSVIFSYLKPDSESAQALRTALDRLKLSDKHVSLMDEDRYVAIKHIKGAYVDDMLLEKMIKKLDDVLVEYSCSVKEENINEC